MRPNEPLKKSQSKTTKRKIIDKTIPFYSCNEVDYIEDNAKAEERQRILKMINDWIETAEKALKSCGKITKIQMEAEIAVLEYLKSEIEHNGKEI